MSTEQLPLSPANLAVRALSHIERESPLAPDQLENARELIIEFVSSGVTDIEELVELTRMAEGKQYLPGGKFSYGRQAPGCGSE
ncbi:hypothetical protein [Rhizobium sp. CECT 9324]|uniref:hypothetical protein n=1 Tax=Rhizobium sp. CECT 9324 TaxID=2845820 RepID=UPI001E479268|nr:hypothetical protein [Rhizobium sp. CECT 9324]CAH0343120.1 hypothetical protein RHI9324_04853 [Rhizobium sp. CECT 9324]